MDNANAKQIGSPCCRLPSEAPWCENTSVSLRRIVYLLPSSTAPVSTIIPD